MPNTEKIKQLNDELRINFKGGRIAITPGVLALGDISTVLKQLRAYDAFDKERNDPCDEHDFGSFEFERTGKPPDEAPLIFFKIDYYDKEMVMGSPDPSEPEVTSRILTVMLADEY